MDMSHYNQSSDQSVLLVIRSLFWSLAECRGRRGRIGGSTGVWQVRRAVIEVESWLGRRLWSVWSGLVPTAFRVAPVLISRCLLRAAPTATGSLSHYSTWNEVTEQKSSLNSLLLVSTGSPEAAGNSHLVPNTPAPYLRVAARRLLED